MKICFFGGTFNPVHNGHIRLLENASKHFAFDKSIVIPTNIPPHKEVIFSVSDDDRLTMCKLAFDGMAEVSDYEIRENTISYTINTIHHFKEIYPDDEFYFLMGSDMLFMFEKWKNYKELISLISIVVASREDDEMSSVEKKKLELEEDGAKIYIIKAEPYVVSSSLIRDKIKSGEKDFSCYLPERVVEYILEKKLYLE